MLKTNLDIISIIPARSGSKGVPGKNLRSLGDVPLISWSITCSKKSNKIDRNIVSTNSVEYAEISKNWGADVPFLRPDDISQDNSTDLDFVLHALNFLKDNGGIPDLLVHLRPTTPFRDPLVVDKAIEFAIKNYENITALRSVHEMSESAYKSFEISQNGILMTTFARKEDLDQSNMNRQTFPLTYTANGYVDVLLPRYILETGELHGSKVKPFLTNNTLEVDTEEDFEALEVQLKILPKFKDQLFGVNNGIL
jgi:N-acylneuraminate cytidylyltransferase